MQVICKVKCYGEYLIDLVQIARHIERKNKNYKKSKDFDNKRKLLIICNTKQRINIKIGI